MKTKLLLLVAAVIGSFFADAQITVNEGNVVGNFYIVRQAHDTLPSGVTIGQAGAAQQWDYASTVTEHEEDSMIFVNPTILPGFQDFPNANLGATFGMQDSSYIFIKKDNTGMRMLGQSEVDMGNVMTFPYMSTIITFPSTMNTQFNEGNDFVMMRLEVNIDPDGPGPHAFVDSVKIIRRIDESSTMDAFGTTSTPLGVFNTIRQNLSTATTDSVFQKTNGSWEMLSTEMSTLSGMQPVETDMSYAVRWWSDNAAARFPVMEMDVDAGGNVQHVSWLKVSPIADIDSYGTIDFTIYPNPANDVITISANNTDIKNMVVYDMKGAVVLRSELNSIANNINVEQLEEGMYLVEMLNTEGAVISSDKFVIKR
jgi:hypothetical protein